MTVDATELKYLINKIQLDIIGFIPLPAILLTAKVVASKLGNEDFKQWVKYELDGYPDKGNLPGYRIYYGNPQATLSNGPLTREDIDISTRDFPEELRDYLNYYRIDAGAAIIEHFANDTKSLRRNFSGNTISAVNQLFVNTHPGNYLIKDLYHVVPNTMYKNIATVTRSKLLDFVLELTNISWNTVNSDTTRAVEQLVVTIFNHHTPGTMATFEERE